MTDRNTLGDQYETPEDVATLYSWANLHGAKYRDFSASRAQTREKARQRVQDAIDADRRRVREEADAAMAAEAARAAEASRAAEAVSRRRGSACGRGRARGGVGQASGSASTRVSRAASRTAGRGAIGRTSRAASSGAQLAAAQLAAQQAEQLAAQQAQLAHNKPHNKAQQAAWQAELAAQQAAQDWPRNEPHSKPRGRLRNLPRNKLRKRQRAAQQAAEQAAQLAAQRAAQEAAQQRAWQQPRPDRFSAPAPGSKPRARSRAVLSAPAAAVRLSRLYPVSSIATGAESAAICAGVRREPMRRASPGVNPIRARPAAGRQPSGMADARAPCGYFQPAGVPCSFAAGS
jgi:hypothetical protein